MLKSKLKIILILFTIISLIFVPFSLADDENAMDIVSDQEETDSSEKTESEQEVTASQSNEDDSFKKSDVYLTGENITIDYIVDGNVFILADNVTISSQIGGDAFICAKTINITEQGYIFSNLFAISDSLNIDGVVYDVYSCADNVTISGYIYRDLKSTCDTLNIFGTIGRNAFISAANIDFIKYNSSDVNNENQQATIAAQGNVSGDLNYSSKSEISIPENSVSGKVNYSQSTYLSEDNTVIEYIISLLTFLVLVSIIWLLALWLAPKFLNKSEALLTKKPIPVLGYGVLTLILLPILAIILILLRIASSVGLLLILLYILLICLSTSLFLITLSNIICKKLNITKKILSFVIVIATSTILWGLSFIPYLGILLKLACIILGLGILTKNTLPNKKEI